VGCLYLKFKINLIKGDTKPDVFAIGTHSLIGSKKNMLIKGIDKPPPPIPPALPKTVITNIDAKPQTSMIPIGHGKECKIIVVESILVPLQY
jgi:hypothetical protein